MTAPPKQDIWEFKIKLPNGNEEIVSICAQTADNARCLFNLQYNNAPTIYGPAKKSQSAPPNHKK